MAPDGSSAKQAKVLQEKAKQWADRVRSGHIRQEEAWHYYETTIRKSLEYPLVASALTSKQCRHIKAPALKVALQSAGLPSNFPRDVLRGTPKLLGLDTDDLYTTQGIKQIRALLDHGEADTITGQSIRAGIELQKLEVGLGGSLFEQDLLVLRCCLTKMWWTHVWHFLLEKRIRLVERTPNLLPQRENDAFLMEAFIAAGYRGSDLAALNRCRMFLCAVTLLDIVSGDGRSLLLDWSRGQPRLGQERYDCPPRPIPTKPRGNCGRWRWNNALR